MNKFVKRYPRAVVRRDKYAAYVIHVLTHPSEAPSRKNVVVKHQGPNDNSHNVARTIIAQRRSEPS